MKVRGMGGDEREGGISNTTSSLISNSGQNACFCDELHKGIIERSASRRNFQDTNASKTFGGQSSHGPAGGA